MVLSGTCTGIGGAALGSGGGGGASGPVTIEGTQVSTNGGGATNIGVVPPAGIVEGELLLMLVCNDEANDADSIRTPTDWTKVGSIGSGPDDCEVAIFWKVATASESTVNVSWPYTGTGFGSSAYYHRISGADTASPIDASAFNINGGAGASHVIPQITTVTDGALALFILSFDGGDGYTFGVAGTGWTKTHEAQDNTGGGGSSSVTGAKEMPAAGVTGTVTVTPSVTDSAVFAQIAIKKA